jgi:glutaredoxin
MVELIIYTQPNCPHCAEVQSDIDFLSGNFPGITHVDLDSKSPSYKSDLDKFTSYGGIGTPSAVLIENGKFTLYGGKENFKDKYLADIYSKAIAADNASNNTTKVVPTKTGTNSTDNKVITTDPPPDTAPASNKKVIGIAAAALLLILILK